MKKTRRHFTLHYNGYSMYPFLKPGDRLIVGKVSPKSLQIGDIVLAPDLEKKYVVHRLVRMLPSQKGILKGDSLLEPDPEPVDLSILSGKVIAIIRKNRLIPLSTDLRSRLKRIYAFLSLYGLTSSTIIRKIKNFLLMLFPLDEPKANYKEWIFITETLCNRIHQTSSEIDWIKIKQVASEEGVIGILYKYFKDKDIPQSALDLFRNYYLSIVALNIININALERLEDALAYEHIEVMTLKGASLLNGIYPDIGMRVMGDLDLMIRPEQQKGFINLLLNLGYKENPLLRHIFHKDRVIIDIHSHAMNIERIPSRSELFPLGMGPVWLNSIPWKEGYRWLRRPDDVDNVLLLSQHLMKHSFSKLIWLVDILKLIKNNDVMFWTDLLKRADYLRQEKPLSYTIFLLNRIFEYNTTIGLGHKDLYQGLSRIERGILNARVNGQSIDLIGPVLTIFYVHGFRKKAALGWESLFPKDELVKHEIIGALKGENAFYYPLRFWRIVAPLLKRFWSILGYIIRG